MRTNRYSLADYEVVVSIDEAAQRMLGINYNSISIGGPGSSASADDQLGSFVGSITVHRNNALWSTEGDATGSWVHNKNLNKTGTCTIDIRQVSDVVVQLTQLCNAFESIQEAVKGMTITVRASNGAGDVAVCNDCYIEQIPDLALGETAATQPWVFTCGQVLFTASN